MIKNDTTQRRQQVEKCFFFCHWQVTAVKNAVITEASDSSI